LFIALCDYLSVKEIEFTSAAVRQWRKLSAAARAQIDLELDIVFAGTDFLPSRPLSHKSHGVADRMNVMVLAFIVNKDRSRRIATAFQAAALSAFQHRRSRFPRTP